MLLAFSQFTNLDQIKPHAPLKLFSWQILNKLCKHLVGTMSIQSSQLPYYLFNFSLNLLFLLSPVYIVPHFYSLLSPFEKLAMLYCIFDCILKTSTLWLSRSVPVTFGSCHLLAVAAAMPRGSAFDSQGQAVFQTGLWCQRSAQCSSQRRSKVSAKANKIGTDWQLGGSQKPLRKMSLSINLVMRPKRTPVGTSEKKLSRGKDMRCLI